MMNNLGTAALQVAFLVALYGVGAALAGALWRRERVVRSAEVAAYVVAVLVTLSSAALVRALMASDFSLVYVADYTSRDLGSWFKFTAWWAGQSGSLLFWGWLLAVFAAALAFQFRAKHRDAMPWVHLVMSFTTWFFLLILNFVSRPFETFPGGGVLADGMGLNPLLQNIGMVIHPPTLFIGYAGLTIPFAFAVAALATGKVDEGWHRLVRRWTLFSWYFLSLGIVLGAWWAYNVLGWGGYWAWDPVENASLLPWLTATAFLHSVMAQEKRGMMRVWNVALAFLTLFLVIFGTFVTRSGIISSVHAFGRSSLGYYFLAFMILLALGTLALVAWRRRELATPAHIESFLSRESAFLLLNLLFSAMTFTVFFGTLFPVISETLTGNKVEVGIPFYNQVMIPAGLVLFVLMAACPLLGWKASERARLLKSSLVPSLLFVGGGVLAVGVGFRHWASVATFAVGAFMVAVIARELFRAAWGGALLASPRRTGGFVIHLSMALTFLGFAGASLNQELSASLRPGERTELGPYTFVMERAFVTQEATYESLATRLKVLQEGKFIGYLTPEKRFYRKEQKPGQDPKPHPQVATLTTWREDVYAILNGVDIRDWASEHTVTPKGVVLKESVAASLTLKINPLVGWIWVGCVVLTLGTVLLFLPPRRRAAEAAAEPAGEAAPATGEGR